MVRMVVVAPAVPVPRAPYATPVNASVPPIAPTWNAVMMVAVEAAGAATTTSFAVKVVSAWTKTVPRNVPPRSVATTNVVEVVVPAPPVRSAPSSGTATRPPASPTAVERSAATTAAAEPVGNVAGQRVVVPQANAPRLAVSPIALEKTAVMMAAAVRVVAVLPLLSVLRLNIVSMPSVAPMDSERSLRIWPIGPR